MRHIDVPLKDDIEEVPICICECHHEGRNILHCAPCCDLTYEDYIVDGKFDKEMFSQAFIDTYGVKPTFSANGRSTLRKKNRI